MATTSRAWAARDPASAEPLRPSSREGARIYPLAKHRPQVLFVTSEFGDFVQAGGLGAVSASLPRALASSGEVRVLLPGFKSVLARAPEIEIVARLPGVAALPPCSIGLVRLADGLCVYLVLCAELYERDGTPYFDAHGVEHADNDLRFARLSLAAAEIAATGVAGWRPDVLHLNDWTSALTAGYLRWRAIATPSVLTIHNLAHLGLFSASRRPALAIPDQAFSLQGVEFYGRISFLKCGIVYASHITTVSQTYAQEITEAELGCGMEGLLRERATEGRLTGIVNGIEKGWDPRADKNCPYLFDPQRWKGRYADFVRGVFGLDLARAPLFSFIARLVHQKGIDLVIAAAAGIVERGGQLVVVGSGEAPTERALRTLAERWPEAIGVRIGFDPKEARAVFAGSDFLLMPSRFEPCGLSQMYAQRFGALPIAHRTGGLAETIQDGKTGLLFDAADQVSLEASIARAFDLYQTPREFSAMRRAAMALDFDWSQSAARYAELYRALEMRRMAGF